MAAAAAAAVAVDAVAIVAVATAAAVGPCTESAGLTSRTDACRSPSRSLLMFVLAADPGGRRSRRRR